MSPGFILNGQPAQLSKANPHETLLDFIRAQGLTGAKEGCAEGECGACMVLLVRPHGADHSQFTPINSCLMPAALAAGHEVWTVEALAQNGRLAEAQQAMVNHGGSQCGYCTPGFVVSLFAEHHRPGRTGPCDPHALAGNLCRCTGYRPIHDAALSLQEPPEPSPLAHRLHQPAPAPAVFTTGHIIRPATLKDALDILASEPAATPIAGATDLGVEANLKHRRFEKLVSLEALPELREFKESPKETILGAALSLAEIAERWQKQAPTVFREWLELFASPPIRNRATLGGSLATASPIGDSAPLLLAFDATLHLASAKGERTVALADFFTAYRKTALAPGELIVAIHLPHPLPEHVRFYKIAKRPTDDISSLAACFALDWEEEDAITRARFAFGGVAPTPVRVTAAEKAVLGLPWDESTLQRAQAVFADTLKPIDDHRASAAYRLAMAQSLLEKFLSERSHRRA